MKLIEALEKILKSTVFVVHIEEHLKDRNANEVVVCKICNKTIDEIWKDFNEGAKQND